MECKGSSERERRASQVEGGRLLSVDCPLSDLLVASRLGGVPIKKRLPPSVGIWNDTAESGQKHALLGEKWQHFFPTIPSMRFDSTA